MKPWEASQAIEISEAMRNIVLTMSRKQLESGRRNVNLTPIEYALFNNRGGRYHAIVKKIVDDLGLPRVSIKNRKPYKPVQHTFGWLPRTAGAIRLGLTPMAGWRSVDLSPGLHMVAGALRNMRGKG
jgi:hypothetical protein